MPFYRHGGIHANPSATRLRIGLWNFTDVWSLKLQVLSTTFSHQRLLLLATCLLFSSPGNTLSGMDLLGKNLIGAASSAKGMATFSGINPATSEALTPKYFEATDEEVDDALKLANAA